MKSLRYWALNEKQSNGVCIKPTVPSCKRKKNASVKKGNVNSQTFESRVNKGTCIPSQAQTLAAGSKRKASETGDKSTSLNRKRKRLNTKKMANRQKNDTTDSTQSNNAGTASPKVRGIDSLPAYFSNLIATSCEYACIICHQLWFLHSVLSKNNNLKTWWNYVTLI